MEEDDDLRPKRQPRPLTEEQRARLAAALRRSVTKPPVPSRQTNAIVNISPDFLPPAKKDAVDEAELLEMVCETERESSESGLGVAPWAYERLAVLYRKRKRHADEVAILERFARQQHAPGVKPARLLQRLNDAKANRAVD